WHSGENDFGQSAGRGYADSDPLAGRGPEGARRADAARVSRDARSGGPIAAQGAPATYAAKHRPGTWGAPEAGEIQSDRLAQPRSFSGCGGNPDPANSGGSCAEPATSQARRRESVRATGGQRRGRATTRDQPGGAGRCADGSRSPGPAAGKGRGAEVLR